MKKIQSEIKPGLIEQYILPAISDEESCYLSAFDLSNDINIIPAELKNAFIAKGLLKEKNGSLILTEDAKKAVAYYPLFGKQKKTRPYIHDFFPVLLSLIAHDYMSIKPTHWARYINSEFFTDIFPSRNKKMVANAGIFSLKSLIDLSIVENGISRLTINKDLAISFLSLNEATRLSYILSPFEEEKEREKIANAISLAFRLRDIKDEELNIKFDIIKKITGFDLSKHLDFLLDFGILYKDEYGYSGSDINIKADDDGIISSDFVYSSSNPATFAVLLILIPVKADITSTWTISKQSVKTAFSFGYFPDDIKSYLASLTRFPLPYSLVPLIDSWYEDFSSLKAQRALILIADDRTRNIIESLPLLKIHILSHPADNVFIMDPDTEQEWRNILTYTGFDMLGNTSGMPFEKKEKPKEFKDISLLPILPESRKVAYDKKKVDMALKNAQDKIQQAFVKAGVLLEAKEFSIEITEGLYFQEKLKTINNAIDEDKLIYIEYIDNSKRIDKPIKIEKEDCETILYASNGKISIDKIWKVAILPGFIRNLD